MSGDVPFVGEIKLWGGPRPPAGWAFCDGSLLAISENAVLFDVIGTTFGGNGQTTFGLPDLAGRVPRHFGNGLRLGEAGGVETVTLTVQELPSHHHLMTASVDPATASTVFGNVPASMPAAGTGSAYGSVEPARPVDPTSVGPTGGGGSHTNLQPYLCMSFIISLFGIPPMPVEEESP